MSKNNSKVDYVTDMELLEKCIFYFSSLRPVLPCSRLMDACSGVLVLVYELIKFLDENNLKDYANNKK